MSRFDLNQLRLATPVPPTVVASEAPRPKPVRVAGRFIRGPIPLEWIQRAAELPGGALALAMALWYRSGLGCTSTLEVSNRLAAEFGLSASGMRRALAALEQEGLIAVRRSPRKSQIVTLRRVGDAEPVPYVAPEEGPP